MLSNKTVLPQRSTLFRFVQYTVISVFLFLIVRHLFNYSEELSHIQDISISEIAMLVVLLFGIYLITSEKMLLILKGMNSQEIQRGEWFKIFCISIFINFHITQGANIYRSLKLKSKFNYPYTDTIGLAGFFCVVRNFSFSAIHHGDLGGRTFNRISKIHSFLHLIGTVRVCHYCSICVEEAAQYSVCEK